MTQKKKDIKSSEHNGSDRPELIINNRAELKIKIAMEHMKRREVSWLGKIKNIGHRYYLEDVFFPPQENQTAFVTTKDDEYPQWFFKMFIQKGIQNKIRLHGHTHPEFAAFSSGTDTDQFKKLMKELDIGDSMVQMILSNKTGPHIQLWTKTDEKTATTVDMKVKWNYTEKITRILEEVTNFDNGNQLSLFEGFEEYLDSFDSFEGSPRGGMINESE